jgi:cell division protein FtsB
MSRILVLNKSIANPRKIRMQSNSNSNREFFSSENRTFNSGRIELNLSVLIFVLGISVFFCGALYLYQVNDIATKGYEIRDLENKIQELSKESKKMEIREVELKSMYNIEKASQELNLINSGEVSYIEMNDAVAMK